MRFGSILLAGSTLLSYTVGSVFSSKPDLEVTGAFGDDNPLSHVYNGQQNTIFLNLVNHAKTDLSIEAISAAFREVGGKERHLANTTTARYNLVLPVGKPVQIPYNFYSEVKPQDLGFTVFVEYSDASEIQKTVHRVIGYDGTVTVKEPQGSWFDLQLLILYPIVLALIALPLYLIYTSFIGPKFFPASAASKRKKRTQSTSVVAKSPTPRPSTPSDPNEWIPEHHLKTRRTVSGRNLVTKGTGGITPQKALSGDETSGNESTSATPRRSARANKGKKAL